MQTERPTDALRLERQLASLRWLVAAFGAVQVGFAIRDRGDDPSVRAPARGRARARPHDREPRDRELGPPGARVRRSCVRSGSPRSRWTPSSCRGWCGSSRAAPRDPVWVIGLPRPARGRGAVGAARRAARRGRVPRGSRSLQENARAQIAAGASQVGVPRRDGLRDRRRGRVVRVVAAADRRRGRGTGRRSGRRGRRARSWRRRRPREAQREVAAFHAAVLADAQPERLAEILRATATRVATELGCEALGLLTRATGAAGEDRFDVAGVSGDPGYLLGDALFPVVEPGGGGRGRGRGRPRRRGPRRPDARARRRGRRAARARTEHGRPGAGRRAADDRGPARGRPSRPPGSAPSRRRPSTA